MKNTSLCYIEQDGKYLLLHRVKKAQDENQGKWIGVGGKFEPKESPEECVLREVREETGLTLTSYRLRGIVTFASDRYETEYMYLFTADGFTGTLTDTEEGVLQWVDKGAVLSLPHWEGDRLFLELLAKDAPFFSLKLEYQGDMLTAAALNGEAYSYS
ncbi:MAG: 8-oxo-dGTP diphosphatase [Clostridiales bacterium]|nr:8-oxo-dGTP diphosphatase [Clostridiales bacterium]